MIMSCFAYNNTGGNFSTNFNQDTKTACTVLSGDPFTNAAGGDFSLNNTAGAGALVRDGAAVGAWPGISTTTAYQDAGAIQHPDPAGGTTVYVVNRVNNFFIPEEV
jgi:hypothetical protein